MAHEGALDRARAWTEQAARLPGSAAFLCYWTAWTSITTRWAREAGLRPHFGLRKNGTLRTHKVHGFKMAEVYPPTAAPQHRRTVEHLSAALQERLVAHESTRYFVERTPTWQGQALPRDTFGQRLNGVIDTDLTLDPRYPVWSPIDRELYRAYRAGEADNTAKARRALAQQVLEVLATTQHNLVCGGDRAGAEAGEAVIAHATALLATLVPAILASR